VPVRTSGKRYAQAIFELALERDRLDQWADDLDFARQVLEDEEFSAFLGHAEVPIDAKYKAIGEVLGDIDLLVRNLLNVLVSKGTSNAIGGVSEAYRELLDDHRGIQRVEVTSAVQLEQQELDRVSAFVSNLIGKDVVVSTQVDETLLGGIVVQIGDQLLDGSTRSRLDALRNQMHTEVLITST
jgi:F-type H+-transporting ATPase subunit delta